MAIAYLMAQVGARLVFANWQLGQQLGFDRGRIGEQSKCEQHFKKNLVNRP